MKNDKRLFSIVNIGTGEIGQRDGADAVALRTAITSSFLPVTLFVRAFRSPSYVPVEREPLRAFRAWSPIQGQRSLVEK